MQFGGGVPLNQRRRVAWILILIVDVGFVAWGTMAAAWPDHVGNTIALVSAMTDDRTVNAIGPFELSEYLGLAVTYGALAVTAPFFPRDSRREWRAIDGIGPRTRPFPR